MRRLRLALLVALLPTALLAGQNGRLRVTQAPASGGGSGGVGCNGACLLATSFEAANGWNADVNQQDGACGGTGFSSIQTNLSNYGSWTADGVNCDGVLATANYASGVGGRALRHYRVTGVNATGGGMSVSLPSTQTKLWMSIRIRYASGFAWNPISYAKDFYWHDGSGHILVCGYEASSYGGCADGGSISLSTGLSWNTVYGGGTSDGSWHCLDYYFDIAATSATIWVDGTQRFTSTSQTFSSFARFSDFILGENQATLATGTFYTDYDDLKIDNDLTVGQRIGCLGSGG